MTFIVRLMLCCGITLTGTGLATGIAFYMQEAQKVVNFSSEALEQLPDIDEGVLEEEIGIEN